MIVALVALVFALSGTAVATHLAVFSTDIVDGTIQGRDIGLDQVGKADVANNAFGSREAYDGAIGGIDIKQNDLTGADINEATLGSVPRVGGHGLAKINFRRGPGSGEVQVFGFGSLRLTAQCAPGGQLVVRARSDAGGGYVLVSGHDIGYRDDGTGKGRAGGDPEFDAGDLVNVGEEVGDGDGNEDLAHLSYTAADGSVVNMQLLLDEDNVVGGCTLTGTAIFS